MGRGYSATTTQAGPGCNQRFGWDYEMFWAPRTSRNDHGRGCGAPGGTPCAFCIPKIATVDTKAPQAACRPDRGDRDMLFSALPGSGSSVRTPASLATLCTSCARERLMIAAVTLRRRACRTADRVIRPKVEGNDSHLDPISPPAMTYPFTGG